MDACDSIARCIQSQNAPLWDEISVLSHELHAIAILPEERLLDLLGNLQPGVLKVLTVLADGSRIQLLHFFLIDIFFSFL